MRIVAGTAVTREMFEAAANPLTVMGLEKGLGVNNHFRRVRAKTTLITANDRIIRVQVKIYHRGKIEIETAFR